MDLQINPVVLIKIVHPSYGYFNNYPNEVNYRLQENKVVETLDELAAASLSMDKGSTLHSA
jgi:hypothetical protein